jgi:SHS2 domain-containing protein
MFSIECNLKKVKKLKKIKISCNAENIEELFVEWLNALLSQSSVKEMMFSEFKVKIKRDEKKKKFELEGQALGEKLSEKHELKTEIKAATYSQLKVFEKNKRFIAQCIVDV